MRGYWPFFDSCIINQALICKKTTPSIDSWGSFSSCLTSNHLTLEAMTLAACRPVVRKKQSWNRKPFLPIKTPKEHCFFPFFSKCTNATEAHTWSFNNVLESLSHFDLITTTLLCTLQSAVGFRIVFSTWSINYFCRLDLICDCSHYNTSTNLSS